MKKFLLISILICFSVYANAQFSIRGKVFDQENKKVLIGAHIIVQESFKVATTNKNGEFELTGIKTQNAELKISFLGYETITETVNLNENKEHLFFLMRSSIQGEETIIRSTRVNENVVTPHTNISKKEIEDMNDARNITSIIEWTPSIITTSDAGTGIGNVGYRIRGSDESRINVTINNVPLNDPESQGAWFVNLPDFASSVDNVQIQRGIGTSSNGSGAFGGSINFQTQKINTEPYVEANEFYGSYNTWKHNLNFGTGLINSKFAFDGRISKITSDGFIDRAKANLNSNYFSAAYYGKKTMIKGLMILGTEKTYQSWDGIPSVILDTNRTWNGIGSYTDANGNQQFYDNETDNYSQNHYQILISHDFNSSLNFSSTFHYTRGIGYYEQFKEYQKYSDYGLDNQIIGNDTLTRTNLIRRKYLDNHFYGAHLSLNYTSSKIPLSIIWGVSANRFENDHYGKIIWMQYSGNIGHDITFYKGNGDKMEASSFLKAQYTISKKISVWADLQVRYIDYSIEGIEDDQRDISQNHIWNFYNPKGGVSYAVSKNQKIFFSYGIGHREPTRANLVDAPEDKQPIAETMYDYELGHEIRLNKAAFYTNIYFMDYQNQLVLTGEINDVGYAIMTNVEKSYRAGIEISSNVKIIKKIDWMVNINLSRNKIQDFTEYVDDWDTWGQRVTKLGETNLSFSPEIVASNIIKYQPIKGFNIELQQKYVGKQYIDNTSSNDRILNPYFVNNVKISYSLNTKLFKEIKLMAMINNIFNEEYETNAWIYRYYEGGEHKVMDGYFPQAGRNFMFGVSVGL